MATYSASTAVTVSFGSLAAARVATAARSLAVVSFTSIVAAHVTFTGRANAAVEFVGDVTGIKNRQYSAQAVGQCTFDATANGGRTINAASQADIIFNGVGSICSAGLGLQVHDAIQAIYSVWGAACQSDSCSSDIGEEAVNCLNAAFQRLAGSGKFHAFIDRVTRTQKLVGTDNILSAYAINLATDIQSVESPVCVKIYPLGEYDALEQETGKYNLRPLQDMAALEAFNDEYFQEQALAQQPLAYYVQITAESVQSNEEGVTIPKGRKTIRLAPYPKRNSGNGDSDADWVLEYDAILKPRRFSCQTPWERLPVPHNYAETLLLPLARYYACSSRFFKGNSELKDAITQQASDVLQQLGDVDPKPKEVANS